MAGRFYVGTSGFSYPEWRGRFYPEDLPAGEMLRHYSRVFPSVEINNTFYRFPTSAQIEEWRKTTPRGFRFSVKAHRLITHIKRLRDVSDPVRVQLERTDGLRDRRGPLLIQLPPSLRRDLPLLQEFLYGLPALPVAIEFRHRSWFADEVYAALAAHHAVLAIMESDEDAPVMEFVGPFVYLRLHRSSYDRAAMDAWAERIREQLGRQKDVYAYFTHEDGAPAPVYAEQLRGLVGGPLRKA
ncbi:MAG: DUF72 domain-containing protein [Armatimonadota bacterium]|nr:DUF72 domain-containing protein [Armatimonadota bacterium]